MKAPVSAPGAELDFSGRSVVVVGGTGGLGQAIARAFASRGARVEVWGTRAQASDYAPGVDLAGLAYAGVDVTNAEAIARAAAAHDALDVLVLAHGTVQWGGKEFEPTAFAHVVNVNLNAVMQCCQALRAALAQRKGCVILLGSIGASQPTPVLPAYNATKAALEGLSRTLAVAWAGVGVRVNVIAPGFVPTRMTEIASSDAERSERYRRRVPLGRLGTAEDVAGVALFLASPLAGYMTGQTLVVDGGKMLT